MEDGAAEVPGNRNKRRLRQACSCLRPDAA